MPNDAASERVEVPLLPLRNVVVFPRTIVNISVGRIRSLNAANMAAEGDQRLVVVAIKDGEQDDPSPEELYSVGTLVEVKARRGQPDATLQIEVEALRRVKIDSVNQDGDVLLAQIQYLPEKVAAGRETNALVAELADMFGKYASLNNKIPADAAEHIRAAHQPGYLADLLAAHLVPEVQERQKLLEMLNQGDRLQYVSGVLANSIDVLETDQRVRDKVRASIDKNQREFYLREQLKAIHDELASEGGNEIAELRERVEQKGLPADVLQRTLKEITRLERMPSVSPESTVLRNYIDWILALPWTERSVDRIDLPMAEQILEEDHYGLLQVKERILDYLAVRQLRLKRRTAYEERQAQAAEAVNNSHPAAHNAQLGSILCFVGPPGVGKTSLGQSIARAMNRKFVRLSLGGVHDEAEIRGHRRTYVGAMPGRIIHAMKSAESVNPIMLLDEIDKMTADMRGDPAAALLEVLDPAQNHTFVDHYLDVPYDLSDVLFIATANSLYNIPRALRDRMEVIEISGYTEEEKVQIARKHLLPKQVEAHGLEPGFLEIPDRMLHTIIRTYTREAGVRELDRKLATICRKSARKVVQGRTTRVRVTPHNLEEFLGSARYRAEIESRHDQVGVGTGLAWTEHGGELLPVEVATMPGRGGLTITGRLGDVMQESARAALSFARSRAHTLSIDLEALEKTDLHIHLPEGAIPKDGPSAGVTMATALISAITGRAVKSNFGMTGEITLTGRVLAIGGLKEKVLAAHRAGITSIIAPLANKSDWADLPRAVRRDIQFHWVESMDQIIPLVLHPAESQPAVPVGTLDENEANRPESSLEEDMITEPGGMKQEITTVQTANSSKSRAASEGKRASGRRNKKVALEDPSINSTPRDDNMMHFEF